MDNPPKPIPIKDRVSFAHLERGHVDVIDGAFVLVDKNGVRTQIPAGRVTCLMLEPGIRITHAAVALAARSGTLLLWTGEGGVRLYSSGQPGGARADKLLWQAELALNDKARLKVVRKMYEIRFGESAPARRSVDQLRGIEGARVRKMYKALAQQFGIEWKGRKYDPKDWGSGDAVNRALSAGTSCLYGVCEAAILAAGYAPAIGFIHSGKPRSFVYDIADLYKFETVVPVAFQVARAGGGDIAGRVRRRCRDVFRSARVLRRVVPEIEDVLSAGEVDVPKPWGVVGPAIPNEERTGDAGHRT